MPDHRTADLSSDQLAQLKRVGFWQSSREPLLPDPRDFLDSAWDAQERDRVIRYLDESYATPDLIFGYSSCRLGCPGEPPDIGPRDLTDGTWIFPEGLAHYLRHHALKPPAEFLEHIRRCNFTVPTLVEPVRTPPGDRAPLPSRRPAENRRADTAPTERASPPPPNTTCFVCGADAYRFFRSRSRAACGACHHRTRLLVGGASLPMLLRSSRSSPLEGSRLNAILNPVEIDGRRGWASFFAGSFQVLEEIHPSRDYFDFAVQHVEPGPTVLRAVHAAHLNPVTDEKELFAVLSAIRSSFNVDELFRALPWVPLAAVAALAALLPITSNEQAWKAVEAQMAHDDSWTPDDRHSHMARLVTLARNRHPSFHD